MSAAGTVLLTILMTPPPTSFLYLMSARSGSMPVVSQSIMKPMVPVGAITVTWRVAIAAAAARFRKRRPSTPCAPCIHGGRDVMAIDAIDRIAVHADDFEEGLLVDFVAGESAHAVGDRGSW